MAQDTLTNEAMHQQLLAKAAQDPAFRASFLKSPKEAIEANFGITLPAGLKISAMEAPADTVVVVLPAAAGPAADGALDDQQLAEVAGGFGQDGHGWAPNFRLASNLPPGVVPFIAQPCDSFPAGGLGGGGTWGK